MTENNNLESLGEKLDRIAALIERAVPPANPENDFTATDTFVWSATRNWLQPVPKVNRVEMVLLQGIDRVRDILINNTARFADGLPANNALLWGARGMGKSSLVKAAHATINQDRSDKPLKLIEIHREDIRTASSCSAMIYRSTTTIRVTRR